MTRLLPLALLLCACGSNPDSFEVSGCSDAEVAHIQDAADRWCEATDGARCVTLDGGWGDSTIECTDALPSHGARYGGAGRSDILIRHDAFRDWAPWVIAAHEFGHHFGCADDYSNDVLMNGYAPRAEITDADVECAK